MKTLFKTILLTATFLILGVSAQAQQSQKDVLKEFSFWLNASGAVGDIVSSAIVIDGVKVKEGNPIASKNGKVALERAILIKALIVYLPTLLYKDDPNEARFMMWVGGAVQWVITIHSAFRQRPSFDVKPKAPQLRWSITF